MKRVLFLPLGIGLAHIGRSIMIARELQKKGMEVVFGVGCEVIDILRKETFPYFRLVEFKRADYDEKIKQNNPHVYTRSLFEKFVLAELKLYSRIKPDLVIYDTRLSVKVSAQIAKIPCISIANADTTRFYDFSKVRFPAQTALVKFLPARIVSLVNRKYTQKFLKSIGPQIMQAVLITTIIPLSPTLIKLGYRLTKDPYQFFLGDLTLLVDIPEFRPVKNLPENIKMVGPVFWDGGGRKLPKWYKEVEKKENIIYVTAGGTGDKGVFLKILEYLKDTNFTIVATTGNTLKPTDVTNYYPNLFVTDYLPGDWIMSRAKLIIFPGGNSTVYQSLNYGVPQICTPLHIDQEDNANQLERLETGILINPYSNLKKNILLDTVERIITDKKYRTNARKFKKILVSYNGAKKAAEEAVKFCYNKYYP